MPPRDIYPTEIRLDPARTSLSIIWENGVTSSFPASLLRERARDARSLQRIVDRKPVATVDDLTITAIEPIGNYAVRLAFSDGHDRGIFPWVYLTDIGGDIARAGTMTR